MGGRVREILWGHRFTRLEEYDTRNDFWVWTSSGSTRSATGRDVGGGVGLGGRVRDVCVCRGGEGWG